MNYIKNILKIVECQKNILKKSMIKRLLIIIKKIKFYWNKENYQIKFFL